MDHDDHVCLCFQVSQRKLCNFLKREQPGVPSRMHECLGAGTGCGWCVPFLEQLHRQWCRGDTPGLKVSPRAYADKRDVYRRARASDQPSEPDESDNS